MKVMVLAGLSMLLGAVCVQASEEDVVIGDIEMPSVDSSMAFKQVEKKVGKWEGKMTQGLTGAVIDVSYDDSRSHLQPQSLQDRQISQKPG